MWKARLSTMALPKAEIQFFAKGNMTGVCYPISDDQYIWTVSASTACLQDAGIQVRQGKFRAQPSSEHSKRHAGQAHQRGWC